MTELPLSYAVMVVAGIWIAALIGAVVTTDARARRVLLYGTLGVVGLLLPLIGYAISRARAGRQRGVRAATTGPAIVAHAT